MSDVQSVVSVVTLGATGNDSTDDTAAIQAAIDQGFKTGSVVFVPAGVYRVSQLTLRKGTILQGVSSGTYPDNNTISGASVIARLPNSNKDLLLAPDGANYCRIFDLALDGNKNNNTAGHGLCVADGAAGQEGQIIVDRCYFHDNPDSNIYLGKNRRANNIHNGVFNYSLNGDGITVAGSDNTIASNILGSNGRAGLCLGTTATQNWAAAATANAAAIAHVQNNDIYGNLVGIAVANGSSGCMITGNGIDRNTYQGVTVYSGSSNALVTNTFHSNGTGKDNAYAHIDVAEGVSAVCISNNNFGPLDSGITNVASYCLHVAPGGSRVTGHIGAVDPTSAHAVSNLQAGSVPWSVISNIGAVIQGSGNDILDLRSSNSTTVTRVSDDGTFTHSGAGGMVVTGVPGATAGARFAGGTASGAPTTGTWKAGDYVIDQTGKLWIHTGSAWLASGGSSTGVTLDSSTPPLADAIAATPGKSAKTAPADHQHPRSSWSATDHGLVTWTMDVMVATASSVLPAAGTLYVCRVHVPAAAPVTNIVASVATAGSGLKSAACFAGLWNASSGALVGATADQSASWASVGLKTMALSGGAKQLAAGDYYIGLYANGTTLPAFARGNSQSGVLLNAGLASNFRIASANTGVAGAPPATLGTRTAASTAWWLALS
jgi:parallel beta-helix repeat protein